jgi:integrase
LNRLVPNLSIQQEEKLVEAAEKHGDTEFATIVKMMSEYGLTLQEVLSLRIEDIDFERGMIRIDRDELKKRWLASQKLRKRSR